MLDITDYIYSGKLKKAEELLDSGYVWGKYEKEDILLEVLEKPTMPTSIAENIDKKLWCNL